MPSHAIIRGARGGPAFADGEAALRSDHRVMSDTHGVENRVRAAARSVGYRLAYTSLADVLKKLDLGYRVRRLVGAPSRLAPELQTTLAQMRRDNAEAPAPFRATALWRDVVRLFDRVFFTHGIGEVESQYFNVRFFGYLPGDHRLYDYLLYTLFSIVRQRDDLGLLQKVPCSAPAQSLARTIEGTRVSLDLLLSIDDFYNLREAQPDIVTGPVVVADIGAGWGRIGYVLKKINPLASYLVFDLPEALLISSTYLPTRLAGIPVRPYNYVRGRPLDRTTLQDGGLWFLGTQDIERVADGALDVVVNVASFQEMTRDQVDRYFGHIDAKATGGRLYLRQLWTGATHGHHLNEVAGYDDYPFRRHWRQLFLRNSTMSDHFFDTAFAL